MNTFSERLKIAIERLGISQAEAARRCGISQQSINYIISNNLISSKLAPKISAALNINPDWLIHAKGSLEETKFYELPIFKEPYEIIKFVSTSSLLDSNQTTIIDQFIGDSSFAYLISPKEMVICSLDEKFFIVSKYLSIVNYSAEITDEKRELSFPIFEWRMRVVDY